MLLAFLGSAPGFLVCRNLCNPFPWIGHKFNLQTEKSGGRGERAGRGWVVQIPFVKTNLSHNRKTLTASHQQSSKMGSAWHFFFFALVLAVVIAATFLTRKGQAKVMFNGAPVALLVWSQMLWCNNLSSHSILRRISPWRNGALPLSELSWTTKRANKMVNG